DVYAVDADRVIACAGVARLSAATCDIHLLGDIEARAAGRDHRYWRGAVDRRIAGRRCVQMRLHGEGGVDRNRVPGVCRGIRDDRSAAGRYWRRGQEIRGVNL